MRKLVSNRKLGIARGSSAAALVVALLSATPSFAQTAPAAPAEAVAEDDTVVVTGSRIVRDGFDQPTPTTVIGEAELRQGQRPNLAQVLNDSPAFRPSVTPQVSVGNTSSGSAPVDLRGLGTNRTLTLLEGRRFVGNNNLNYVPMSLVERVEVVTGGASAAWGSDAVAGVVNIILKDSFKGVTVGGVGGISTRGDGARYGGDITAGTSFADGRGQIMVTAEYVKDESIPDRNSRDRLGSAGIVRLNPTSTTDLRQILVPDVNYGNQTPGGLITTGVLAGQMFNSDGTLRTYGAGTSLNANPAIRFPSQVLGGADAVGLYDVVAVTTPLERISAYGRATYDFGAVKLWADVSYGRSQSTYAFLPDIGISPALTISATNPFLSQTIRTTLANAGETSFTLGRFFTGPYSLIYDGTREQKEGAIGIEADLGGGWKANAHFSHGEVDQAQRIRNARIVSRFNAAINAVSSGGQIVCGINADASTTNDDAACRPLNLFGLNAASPEALAYIRGTQQNDTVSKLDSAAVQIQGDLFSLWAGPVTVAFGAESRWEEQKSVSGALDLAGAFGPLNLYGSPVSGGFDVQEGFAEIALPLLDIEGTAKIDTTGAARYSDYSRSGGIWSWKGGANVTLFDTVMFRGTRSRDIRAPTIGELFSTRAINVGPLVDRDTDGRAAANAAYNPTPATVTTYSGGNPDLMPEISHTTALGVSFTPKFIPGFKLSVDYYDIKIDGAISTLSGSNLTLACKNGNAAACARITRDATGTVTEVRSNSQNLAIFETGGVDIEASYVFPMSAIANIPGTMRIRALATHVREFVIDTGVSRVDTAGDVGAGTGNAIPSWRGVLSFAYQNEVLGLDARVRYVGAGKFNSQLDQSVNPTGYLVNNDIGAYTYLDMGARAKVMDRVTLSLNINNVLDQKPPLSPVGPVFYDAIGTYFTFGARLNF
ncbi:TonB-dependent receptor domain-containing protein [Sphingomonas sp. J315]|uniref:TonB-dependent receptor domain-containing protein n=1 Tax=Sphingomonas sp. J315 TaxID=2898433 RepID=UPI0021ADB76D|nr:TonB-dependent receptor [Sphingomonas sp. J315]UUX98101.1 TonB-dependent receptor [Sphingomonas sp. J315]